MKIKQVFTAVGLFLTGFAGTASAAVTQNGTQVYVQPDAANGYNMLSQFSLFDYLMDFLDVINYLVYIAAVIVALYCTLLVIISIVNGKRDPRSIRDEISGQDGLKKTVKIIIYMKIVLMVIDFVFYIS
ncbi:MAG: hypothetical protein PHR29_06060 [Acholeplasmataceae bacterium]|nr:hypothetical protein [Acholeplasmataceae bacterium]